LTSSRDYLQVAGETTYHVPTLSVPKDRISLEGLAKHEAVRLFIDRAAASMRGFGLTEQNAAAVADICYCLDGIPLAIELAAARVRSLSVQAISARLSDRFRLLVTGDQTVLPRQRTLRALIDWSYDLLAPPERALFQRLAVFAGGWTLDAAEVVCADGDLPQHDVLQLLIHLIEKSLVIMEVGGERYRMLDTVRHYAQEKLIEAGEEMAVRSRHLTFYLSVVESARPQLLGPEQGLWLARLDIDRDNVLSAHTFCDQHAEGADFGLRLTFSMKFYWLNRGLLNLGHRTTLHALMRAGARERNFGRSRGLCDAGQLCCFMGRYKEARAYLEESLSIAREIGDTTRVAAVLQPLGMASLGLGDAVQARRYLEESVALARAQGNKRQLAAAINALAQLYRAEKDLERAKSLYEDVVSLSRELRDRQSIAIGLLNLAMVSIGSDAGGRARELLLEVFTIAEETGSKPAGQSALEVSAGLYALEGKWTRAARLFGAAEAQAEKTGLRRDAVDEAFLAPLMNTTREALSKHRFAAEEAKGRALSYEDAISEARDAL
jgi:non-specific serine/threonine protein kinase